MKGCPSGRRVLRYYHGFLGLYYPALCGSLFDGTGND